MKCDYYGCKGEAIEEVEVPCISPNDDYYTTIVHMCEKCYKEYVEVLD